MANIKIPSGPREVSPTQASETLEQTVESSAETAAVGAVDAAATAPLDRIAQQVAAGEIDHNEAVEQIIREVIGERLVATAPGEVAAEVEEVLRALLATDPQLKALLGALGTANEESKG